jgi:hypothetical protein
VKLLDPSQEAPLHFPEQAVNPLAARSSRLNAVGVRTGVTEIHQQVDLLVAQAEQMFRADPRRSHGLIIQGN